MILKPLHDRVVVQRDEAERKTPGGLVLPDVAKEKPQRGKILAVGDGKKLDSGERCAMDVAPGDRVLFAAYSGNEIEIEGERLLILKEEDILAVIGKA